MILRRVINHMKSQHWTGVVIELVIVVLGVFIGLQVDNWNQARELAARRDAALQRLHDESEQDVLFFRKMLDYFDRFNRERSEAIRRLIDNDWKGADMDAMTEGVVTISMFPAAAPPRSAYDEVIASGMFGDLGSPVLRKDIAGYYASLSFLQGQVTYLRSMTAELPDWRTPGIKVVFEPGGERQRRYELDVPLLVKDKSFIKGLLIGNSGQRAMTNWWRDTEKAAESMCRALAKATGRPCAPLQKHKAQP